MAAGAVEETDALAVDRVRVTLLGPFSIKLDERCAGPWYRPAARRLCELLMLTPSHRLGREAAREFLFPKLAPVASASALSTALSLAREALAPLGQVATALLRADRAIIWVDEKVTLDIDAAAHEQALRSALRTQPGAERDSGLSTALQQDRALLDEEPYADWVVAPREALELLRQRARLELARDRPGASGGYNSRPSSMPGRTVLPTTRRQRKQLPRWCGSTRPRGSVSWLRVRSSVVAPPSKPSGWPYRPPSRRQGAPLTGPFLMATRFAARELSPQRCTTERRSAGP